MFFKTTWKLFSSRLVSSTADSFGFLSMIAAAELSSLGEKTKHSRERLLSCVHNYNMCSILEHPFRLCITLRSDWIKECNWKERKSLLCANAFERTHYYFLMHSPDVFASSPKKNCRFSLVPFKPVYFMTSSSVYFQTCNFRMYRKTQCNTYCTYNRHFNTIYHSVKRQQLNVCDIYLVENSYGIIFYSPTDRIGSN